MDINTNLKDDEFLFPKTEKIKTSKKKNASGIIVATLNRKNIQTVGDLINYDPKQFSGANRYYFRALAQILRYKYLNIELINDVLLESKYTHSLEDQRKLAKDLKKLGFSRYLSLREVEAALEKFLMSQQSDIVTMEDVLESDSIFLNRILDTLGNTDFKGFYLDYLKAKREKDKLEQKGTTKETLENLKAQLKALAALRTDLDKQIQEVQEKINVLGGLQNHGRKY